MTAVRVLIVDDSLTMRRLIRLALSGDARIDVVGEARDAMQARERLHDLRPDVMTLDVEMPCISGLDFLSEVMRDAPLPIVMVSTETHKGSDAAVEALALGAVECIGKPQNATSAEAFAPLRDAVVHAAQARVRPRVTAPRRVLPNASFVWNGRYAVIGSSTGGVEALERILGRFPKNCPPTVIVQHMPEGFLAKFAQRLDARIEAKVALASTGAPLLPGRIYIAPGGSTHLTLLGPRAKPVCQLSEGERRLGHRPSIDNLFESAAHLGGYAVAALLTGMGRDGADGMLWMRRMGSTCLAQDKDSSLVWGMPRAAWESGAAERLVGLDDMADAILQACGRMAGRVASA